MTKVKTSSLTYNEFQFKILLECLKTGLMGLWDSETLLNWLLEHKDIVEGGVCCVNQIYIKFKFTPESRKTINKFLKEFDKTKGVGDERYWVRLKDDTKLLQIVWK